MTEQEKREKAIDWIKNPLKWHHYPYLPMKRGEFPNGWHGVLAANRDGYRNGVVLVLPIVIYKTNLFCLPDTEEEWQKIPTKSYLTIEDLLNDGWEVD